MELSWALSRTNTHSSYTNVFLVKSSCLLTISVQYTIYYILFLFYTNINIKIVLYAFHKVTFSLIYYVFYFPHEILCILFSVLSHSRWLNFQSLCILPNFFLVCNSCRGRCFFSRIFRCHSNGCVVTIDYMVYGLQ